MKVKAVFFDLDGTLLPMDQDTFIKAYLGDLVKVLAPKGYEPKAIAGALWRGTEDMVKKRRYQNQRAGVLGQLFGNSR